LSPKNGPLGRHAGPGKDGQNGAKTPLFVTFPPEKLKPKMKNFFFDFDYKTCWIHRGFEQLPSSIAWRVIGLQSSARKVAHTGLKRLTLCVSDFTLKCIRVFVVYLDIIKSSSQLRVLLESY